MRFRLILCARLNICLLLYVVLFGAISVTQSYADTADAADDGPVLFHDGAEKWFKLQAYTSTDYIVFKPDATYSRIDREHMMVVERDRGKWVQADSGEITMTSELQFRRIECGPLQVYVHNTTTVANLPAVKTVISKFLDSTTSSSFTRKEVENIEKYGMNNVLSRVEVDYSVKEVSRRQLQELLAEIDHYISDNTKNVFHVIPRRFDEVTYLLWKDMETPLNRDRDKIEKAIRTRKAGKLPPLIYFQSDPEQSRKEANTTQPFIYYPELNKRTPASNVTTSTKTQTPSPGQIH